MSGKKWLIGLTKLPIDQDPAWNKGTAHEVEAEVSGTEEAADLLKNAICEQVCRHLYSSNLHCFTTRNNISSLLQQQTDEKPQKVSTTPLNYCHNHNISLPGNVFMDLSRELHSQKRQTLLSEFR